MNFVSILLILIGSLISIDAQYKFNDLTNRAHQLEASGFALGSVSFGELALCVSPFIFIAITLPLAMSFFPKIVTLAGTFLCVLLSVSQLYVNDIRGGDEDMLGTILIQIFIGIVICAANSLTIFTLVIYNAAKKT